MQALPPLPPFHLPASCSSLGQQKQLVWLVANRHAVQRHGFAARRTSRGQVISPAPRHSPQCRRLCAPPFGCRRRAAQAGNRVRKRIIRLSPRSAVCSGPIQQPAKGAREGRVKWRHRRRHGRRRQACPASGGRLAADLRLTCVLPWLPGSCAKPLAERREAASEASGVQKGRQGPAGTAIAAIALGMLRTRSEGMLGAAVSHVGAVSFFPAVIAAFWHLSVSQVHHGSL